jgi:signal transduction histidine kinase
VPGVAGTWKDLTDSVNFMAGNLTAQLRDVSKVATAIAKGDLSQKITVNVSGEILQIKETMNTMVDQLNSFASEIFEEFIQLASAAHSQFKGTGLGLPLCRKLAELLGGRIDLESELGVGSKFALTLPARYVTEEQTEGVEEPAVLMAEVK